MQLPFKGKTDFSNPGTKHAKAVFAEKIAV